MSIITTHSIITYNTAYYNSLSKLFLHSDNVPNTKGLTVSESASPLGIPCVLLISEVVYRTRSSLCYGLTIRL